VAKVAEAAAHRNQTLVKPSQHPPKAIMSNILDTILREVGPGTLAGLGGSIGVAPEQMQSVATLALPAMLGGLANNAMEPEGAQALATALDRDHVPNLLEQLGPLAGALLGGGGGGAGAQPAGGLDLGSLLGAAAGMIGGAPTGGASAPAPGAVPLPKALDGTGILGHIFGGNAASIVEKIAGLTKLDLGKVTKILVTLGPILMSALGTLKSKLGLDAAGLAGLLTQDAAAQAMPKTDSGGFDLSDLGNLASSLLNNKSLSSLFS
jgi:hypothetical protein